MDIHIYFALALWSLLGAWVFLYVFHKYLPWFKFAFTYFIHLKIRCINSTVPEIGAIILYLTANAIALYFEGLSSSQRFAIINLVLLFIGGRTSPIADNVGIPLREYSIAHQWVGITVVTLSLIHTGRDAAASLDKFQKISGSVLAGCLCLCLAISLFKLLGNSVAWVSKLPYALCQNLHRLLAVCVLASLGWHLWTVSRLFSFAGYIALGAGCLWIFSVVLRFRTWYGYRSAKLTIESPKEEVTRSNITRLTLDTGSTIPALPGTYLYINIPGQHSSICVPIVWWTDEENGLVRHVEVLINRAIGPIPSDFRLRLGGPYGGDLNMGSFETVVLAAEGIGISGILPFALSIISRKQRDVAERAKRQDAPLYCDITRNIDLFWKLDSNGQYDCAAGYFTFFADILRDIESYTRPQNAVSNNTLYETQTHNTAPNTTGLGIGSPKRGARFSLLRVFIAYPDRLGKDIKMPELPNIESWRVVKTTEDTLSERIQRVANGKPGRTLVTGKTTHQITNLLLTLYSMWY